MQIKRTNGNEFEIKAKEATVQLNDGIKISDIHLAAPGEYEIAGVFVNVIASDDQNIFTICSDDINVCYLDGLKKSLSAEAINQLDDVDILFLPVGAKDSLDLKQALVLLQKIDPKIVIPIFLENETEFLKSEGTSEPRREKVLKIQKSQLPAEEEREIVILE